MHPINPELDLEIEEKFFVVYNLIQKEEKLKKAFVNQEKDDTQITKSSAKEMLLGVKSKLEKILEILEKDSPNRLKFTAKLASVLLLLGTVCADLEENSDSLTYLETCLKYTEPYKNQPEVVLVQISALSQIAINKASSEPEVSLTHLEDAEKCYLNYKEGIVPPVVIPALFKTPEKDDAASWSELEKLYTLVLYYLAQTYGALKEPLKSAVYCLVTLQKQLEFDYDPIDWALNVATMSQFLLEQNGFKEARNHLSASLFVLEKYQKELEATEVKDEFFEAQMESFRHRSADIARCWAKYGIILLQRSKERLMEKANDIPTEDIAQLALELSALNLNLPAEFKTNENIWLFTKLELTPYENQITDEYLLTYDDAKLVFTNAMSWLTEAQAYYTLDHHASDHINIILDMSQCYLHLLFFEECPENQSKLHKRRVDLLEKELASVNSKFYLTHCQQMWFELGITYLEMIHIKSDKLRDSSERPTPHALNKINHLVEKGIEHFNNFLTSLDDKKTNFKDPDIQKPFLRAHFHIAVLHGKFITLDNVQKSKNTEASLKSYKTLVDFCRENPDSQKLIQAEFDICKEMVCVLPLKIAKLKSGS